MVAVLFFLSVPPKIPNVIHKVYIEDSMSIPVTLPPEIQEAHDSWRLMNPEYTIKYYSGVDCIEYLRRHFGEKHVTMFDTIKAYAGKCDFFRYCVLYREGGWYSDWKQTCLEPIDSWVDMEADIVLFYDHGCNSSRKNHGVANALIGCVPKHVIPQDSMHIVEQHIRAKHYGKTALETTGPIVLGEALQRALPALNKYECQLGVYGGRFFTTKDGLDVVEHKCKKCSRSQDWGKRGNNYHKLWSDKTFYGEKHTL